MELEKSFRRAGDVDGQDRTQQCHTQRNKAPQGQTPQDKTLQDKVLSVLYGNRAGRMLLRPLVSPWVSRIGGKLLSTRLSTVAVTPFVRANHIDLSMCEKQSFDSYNDFFTRKLKPEARPIDHAPDAWISPCDGRLSVYPITAEGSFQIKHTQYTLESLLKNSSLAKRFLGGKLWLYRLCVDDYHRYIFPEGGIKSKNIRIPGIFHTVNPIANDHYPIYKENTREYCLIKTENFGTILMMEVGALLVGKIENKEIGPCSVCRGEEKGNFAFGGSTIVVLTQDGKAVPENVYVEHTEQGIETKVKQGEKVGKALK